MTTAIGVVITEHIVSGRLENQQLAGKLLRQALPRVAADAEPERDLWPAVLRRLDARVAAPASPASFSTCRVSPGATRYCLPPVSMTAYIFVFL